MGGSYCQSFCFSNRLVTRTAIFGFRGSAASDFSKKSRCFHNTTKKVGRPASTRKENKQKPNTRPEIVRRSCVSTRRRAATSSRVFWRSAAVFGGGYARAAALYAVVTYRHYELHQLSARHSGPRSRSRRASVSQSDVVCAIGATKASSSVVETRSVARKFFGAREIRFE